MRAVAVAEDIRDLEGAQELERMSFGKEEDGGGGEGQKGV